ncbi:unnamed protein product [Effrenium voratum]|uniref:Uncharacterized protein n=1 Tax=Effrenium voratum TaxID=2562239 RepID=A0AA36IGH5_9DINO|nr:unnamed protein product [Effrenium voratum]
MAATLKFRSLVMLPFVGADPGTSTLPQLRPRALEFEDTNPLAAKVYGTLTITSAASEVNFTHYHVYYGYFSRIWPDGSEPFAIVPATSDADVNTFLVFCKNSHGQAEISRRLGILDSSMILLQDPVVAPSYIDGQLHLEVTTEMSGPGARVDVAVVPKGAESKAQSSGNFRQLDFGPITASTVCLEANIQYDVTSGSKVIGPCFFEPSQETIPSSSTRPFAMSALARIHATALARCVWLHRRRRAAA